MSEILNNPAIEEKQTYNQRRINIRNKHYRGYKKLLRRYEYKCAVCGWQLPYNAPSGRKQLQSGCDIHHIIQVSAGGSNEDDNLILLCPNHHKEADEGCLSVEFLQAHIKKEVSGTEWLKLNHRLAIR